MKFLKLAVALPLALAGLTFASISGASAGNFVQNGDFSSPGAPPAWLNGYSTYVTDWTNTDTYTLYVPPGQTADQTFDGLYGLAGPNLGGVNNGLVGPPGGGGQLAIDGDINFSAQGVYQSVGGLVSGKTYTLSFEYALGQEWCCFSSPVTGSFDVSLGDQSWSTPTLSIPNYGFSGWYTYTQSFTWDGAGNTLTFLAVGAPSGEPPWPLLADVSLTAVPEASTWVMIVAGFAGLGLVAHARRSRTVAA